MRKGVIAALLAVCLLLGGCGLLGSEERETGPGPGVEQREVAVALCCGAMDLLPFYHARAKGYFLEEGLNVTANERLFGNGGESVTNILNGAYDIGFASYTPFIEAEAKIGKQSGTRGGSGLRLIADATALKLENTVLLVRPSSEIRTVRQLSGKRIGVTAVSTMTYFLAASALNDHGIGVGQVQWVEMQFAEMAAKLMAGNVDAILVTEPFRTMTEVETGAGVLYDTGRGATAEIPIGGYGARADWVASHPRTVAAFQRALGRATAEVEGSRRLLEELLIAHGGKELEGIAGMVKETSYKTSLDPGQLQRVVDLIQEFGKPEKVGELPLPENFDVSKMIVRPAA